MSRGLEADKRQDDAEHERLDDQGRRASSGDLPPLFDAIVDLQRLAGNEAVTELLMGEHASPVAVQRNVPPSRSHLGQTGLPEDYKGKDDAGKIAAIRQLLAEGKSGYVIAEAWRLLSDEMGMAKANPDLFKQSVAKDDDILDHDAFNPIRETFKKDVEGTALNYTFENRQMVLEEMAKTGVDKMLAGKEPGADEDAAVQDVQKLVPEMGRVKEGKEKAKNTVIGYTMNMHTKNPFPKDARFSPEGPPEHYHRQEGKPTWDEVNKVWMQLVATEAAIIRAAPSAAYFMQEGVPSKMKDIADIKAARGEIAKALQDLFGKIEKAAPLIGDDLTYMDFPPIHQQLLGGQPAPSGTKWANPVESAVAKEEVSDANTANLLKMLGIGTLAAAFFLFASVATAGGAAALGAFLFAGGAVTSGLQAAGSWDKYRDLATAHASTVDPDMALVTGEQVDAALLSAVLDTAFALLDGWQAAKGAVTALKGGEAAYLGAKAGASATTRVALANIASAADPRAVLVKGMEELGPDYVAYTTRKSFDELAEIAGKETDLGKRLLARAAHGTPAELTELLEKLPRVAELAGEEGDAVLQAALKEYGTIGTLRKVGGWEALEKCKTFTEGRASAKALEGWRAGIEKELGEYIAKESEQASKTVRTGTVAASSDLDVSVVGGAAGELTRKAEGWLSGRLGMSISESKKLLHADIFVDPFRAHLADVMKELDPAVRDQINKEMVGKERAMIWGAKYHDAIKAGKSGQEVLDEAARMGVTDVMKDFKPLTAAERTKAAELIDGMMKQLADPKVPAGRKAELVSEVSTMQARINASNPSAYVGGGVHVWVTGRDQDIAKLAEAMNVEVDVLKAISSSKRLTAAMSEIKFIDAAVNRLRTPNPHGSFEEMANAIVDIGKHGKRTAQQLEFAGAANPVMLREMFNALDEFHRMPVAKLIEQLRAGKLGQYRTHIDILLTALKKDAADAVKTLADDARLAKVDLAGLSEWQKLNSWQIRYAQLVDAARGASAAYIETLHIALEAKVKNAPVSSDIDNESVPPEPNFQPVEGEPVHVP